MISYTHLLSKGTMASLSYELNGHNGVEVTPSDIGLIIGKGAKNLKSIISGAWNMYERLQDSENRVEEEKPKLRIILNDHDEGIKVEIISESETMQKLAQKSISRNISGMLKKRNQNETLKTEHFIIDYPERLLGKLIGKGGAGLKRLQNDIIYQDKKVQIHKDDVATAKTARIRVDSLNVEPDEDGKSNNIIKAIKERNTQFLGWPPSPDDEYEHHIKLTLSFKRDAKPFQDKSLYIDHFKDIVIDRISQIKSEDDEQMDDINECLGFD